MLLRGQRAWFLGLLCFGMVLSMLMARRWLTPAPEQFQANVEVFAASADDYTQPVFVVMTVPCGHRFTLPTTAIRSWTL